MRSPERLTLDLDPPGNVGSVTYNLPIMLNVEAIGVVQPYGVAPMDRRVIPTQARNVYSLKFSIGELQ